MIRWNIPDIYPNLLFGGTRNVNSKQNNKEFMWALHSKKEDEPKTKLGRALLRTPGSNRPRSTRREIEFLDNEKPKDGYGNKI